MTLSIFASSFPLHVSFAMVPIGFASRMVQIFIDFTILVISEAIILAKPSSIEIIELIISMFVPSIVLIPKPD